MKRILLFSLFLTASFLGKAASGIFESYAVIAGTSYDLGATTANIDLNGYTFPTTYAAGSSLTIGGEVKTFKNGSDNICGAKIWYSIYLASGSPGAFTSVTLPFFANLASAGDQQWKTAGAGVTLPSVPGNYKIAFYVTDIGDGAGGCTLDPFHTVNNSGANYIANLTICGSGAGALAAGTYTIGTGACFTTIQTAATYMNTNGIAGPVVFNVPSGYTETAAAGGIQFNAIAGTSATNTITFQKVTGATTNPKVTAPLQTAGFIMDAVIKFVGTDFITFDGIDVSEGAGVTTAIATNNMTEAGYGIFNNTVTDGCQNVTIKNCKITMNQTYQNAFGIFANNSILFTNGTAQTAGATTLSANLHNNLKIYGNTISSTAMAIVVVMPTTISTLAMTGLDIGGTSAATGNTINTYGNNTANFGYTNMPTTVNAAILIRNASGYNCSYNTITDAGFSAAVLHYGILGSHGTSPTGVTFTSTANNNTVTVTQPGILGVSGIDMANGATVLATATYVANSNTVNVTQTSALAASGAVAGIILNSGGAAMTANSNTVTITQNNTGAVTTSSSITAISTAAASITSTANNNTITITQNNTTTGVLSGTVLGITAGAAMTNSYLNTNIITIVQNATTTGTYSGAYNAITATGIISGIGEIKDNQIKQWIIRSTSTSGFIINENGAHTGTVTISGNVTSGTTTPYINKIGTLGGTMVGIYNFASSASGTTNVFNNTFSEVLTSGTMSFTGINEQNGGSGQTRNVYNNIINNISGATTGTIIGITTGYASTLNCYSNTVSNITGGGTVTGIVAGTSSTTANVYSNVVFNLTTNGVASILTGINGTVTTTGTYNKNRIYNLSNTASAAPTCQVIGINLTAGSLLQAHNNSITGLTVNAACNNVQAIIGISANAGTNANINHNTIKFTGTGGATGFGMTGVLFSSAYTAFNFKNNIINIAGAASGNGMIAAVRRSGVQAVITPLSTTAFAADNNIYQVPTAQYSFVYAEGTNTTTIGTSYKNCYGFGVTADDATNNIKYETVTNFNTSCAKYKGWMASGHEQNVFSEDNLATASALVGTFVPSGITYAEGSASTVTVPTPISDDLTGAVRPGTPDRGAIEFTGTGTDASPPAVSFTDIPSSSCVPVLSATITDASGINTTTGTKPRFYYKKFTDNNVYLGNTSGNNGWKFVEASNSSSPYTFLINESLLQTPLAAADVVQYFVIAQDLATTPNVGITSGSTPITFCPTTVDLVAAAFPLGGTIKSFIYNAQPTSVATAATVSTICLSGTTVASLSPTGGALGGMTYQWQNSTDGGTTWNPISGATSATYTSGTLTAGVKYRAAIACNGTPITASPSTPVDITVNAPTAGTAVNATRCGTGTVNLAVTGSTGTVSWYSAATGGTNLGSGTTFATPAISTTTTYYAGAVNGATASTTGRVVASTPGSATNLAGYTLIFTTTKDITLNSVDVYSSTGTAITIQLYDAAGTTSLFTTGSYSTAVGVKTTVPLGTGWVIPAGTYRLTESAMTLNFYRDSGTAPGYPYALGTSGNITGFASSVSGSATTGASYYFFYNWNITEGCASTRVPVTATVTTPPSIALSTAAITRCGFDTPNSISVTSPNDPNYTYTWSPTAGISATTGSSLTTNATTTTTYVVTATDASGGANNGCVNTGNVVVTVSPTPSAIILTPSTAVICDGNIQTINTSGGAIANIVAYSENFDGGAAGWTITNGGASPAVSNWQYITAPYTDPSGSATFLNFTTLQGGKFAYSTPDAGGSGTTTNTILTSPSFSTVGYTNLTMTFEQAYQYYASGAETVVVEGTTDGGVTWGNLKTNNPTSAGVITNNAQTTVGVSIVLTAAYSNQANVQVRFRYISTWGYYWVLDDIKMTGTGPGSKIWSPTTALYTDAAATTAYTGTNAAIVYAKPSASTTYTATTTASSGCSTISSVPITVNSRPTAVISGGGATCAGAAMAQISIALTGQQPWSVTYSIGGIAQPAVTNITSSPYQFIPTVAGTYTVTAVSDANSCVGQSGDKTGTAVITVKPLPTSVVSGGGAVCTGTTLPNVSIALTGMAPWSITYTDGTTPTTVTTTTSNPYIITGATAGTYTVTSLSDANCTAISSGMTGSATITVNPTPATPTISGTLSFCSGGSTVLTSSSTTGNQWYKGGVIQTGETATTYTATTAGSYTVVVTNVNGCSATSAVTNVTVNPLPTITLGTVTAVCNTAISFDLPYSATTGTPNQYSITTGTAAMTGFTAVSNATLGGSPIAVTIPSGSTAGTYDFNLTVRNSTTGCISSVTPFTVTVSPNVDAGSVSGTSPLCVDATTTFTVSGNTATGSWSSSNTAVATVDAASGLVTGVAAGNAFITYSITSGCGASIGTPVTATASIAVNAKPAISSQSTAGATYCLNETTVAALSVTATGAGLAYQWYSNAASSNTGGTLIASATSASYTPSTSTAGTTYYYCVVSGTCTPSVTSAVSGAVVISPIPAIPTVTTTAATCAADGSSVVSN